MVNLRHLALPEKVADLAKAELQGSNARLCIELTDDIIRH